ncbi:MAG: DUF1858 domain-containing protein [Candidatus Aenigmatarchaeota archaeon]
MKKKITEKMPIAEIIELKPASAEIMMNYGLHCVGCHIASWETLEEGAKAHGLSKEKIKKMVGEINKLK